MFITYLAWPMKKENQTDNATRDLRQFAAAGVFVLLLVLLLCYLTFIPVPEANKDLIVTIMGVLVGGGAAAMPKLFGEGNDQETQDLKRRLLKMEAKYGTLKEQHDRLTQLLIEKHIVDLTE